MADELVFHRDPRAPGVTVVARNDLYIGEITRDRGGCWWGRRGDNADRTVRARTRKGVAEKLAAWPPLSVTVTVEQCFQHHAKLSEARRARGDR